MPTIDLGTKRTILLSCVIVLAGCRDGRAPTEPSRLTAGRDGPRADASPRDATASVRWNALGRQLMSTPPFAYPRAPTATRVYALLSVAQYAAAVEAKAARREDDGRRVEGALPSVSGAVAGASAAMLSYLFPSQSSLVATVLAAEQGLGPNDAPALARGIAVGAVVAQRVIASASTDGADAVVTLQIPIGPGYWFGTPVTPQWPSVRPWLMSSGDALRPAAPPAFGSPAFQSALAEVKAASALAGDDPVRIEQIRLVRFWEDPPAAGHHAGHWNAIASAFIVEHHLSELRAARTLALTNMAIADAAIACMDAKYHFWLIRPYQADASIQTVLAQPPHASYPSLHSCQTGAAAGVLAAIFPEKGDSLARMEQEMNVSRIYAGLHYRFDVDTGLAVGHRAAALAVTFGKKGDVFSLLK